jgi:hypothetical protein
VSIGFDEVARFIEAQKEHHAPILSNLGREKVLSFMVTSAASGRAASAGISALRGVAPGAWGAEVELRLAAGLPRAPERGECIAVSMCEPSAYVGFKFFGFQLKSHALLEPSFAPRLHQSDPGNGTRVFAPRVFTIHHGPQTANFFEKIPFEEVSALAAKTPYVLTAVGEQANISPRWIFHHELRDGRLELFHGDSLQNKTYMNIRRNSREVRLILDLRTWTGFALDGTVEELNPAENRSAASAVEWAFARGGLKSPSRIYRHRAARAWRIGPAFGALESPSRRSGNPSPIA